MTDLITHSEALARLRLIRTSGLGPVHYARLLSFYGSGIRTIDNWPDISRQLSPKARMGALCSSSEAEDEWADAQKCGARPLFWGQSDYPELLSRLDRPPPFLWAIGPLITRHNSIALVGARTASMAGLKMAETLAQDLGVRGFHTVSGLARGIDTHAHRGSLNTGTIAVLGGGVDDIYPPENKDLYDEIATAGLIISESKMGYKAKAQDFSRRNRIIAGLARATIVVEAELRSGSLITARLALEANRDLLAVPGSPLDERARGSNDLIRRGAHICENADDVISILSPLDHDYQQAKVMSDQGGLFEDLIDDNEWPLLPSDQEQTLAANDYDELQLTLNTHKSLDKEIMALMGAQEVNRDWLIRTLKATPSDVMTSLMDLEIQGLIELGPEGAYRRLI